MKKVLLLSFALMLVASLAFAQAGSIGIFADPAATNCNLADAAPGLGLYYIVHVFTGGATGSEWAATKPACHTGMWLSDMNQFAVVLGNTQTGYSVGYGACKIGTVHICTMQMFNSGTTPACCLWQVVPHPANANGRIEGSDCNFDLILPTGGAAIVNSNTGCNCNVPTQDTTWGGVKALFE